MLVTLSGIDIEVNLSHPENALSTTFDTPSAIVMEVSFVLVKNIDGKLPNAHAGIVAKTRPLQLSNAASSIFVTLFGMDIEARLLQP